MKTLLKLLVSLAVLAAFTVKAHATASLTIFDGTTTITVTDGSVVPGAVDANSAAGAITWVGSIGVWNINVSTGLTYPVQGSATAPNMDLSSVNHSAITPGLSTTGAGTLTLTFTDTFTTPSLPAFAQIGGTQDNGSIVMTVLQNGVAIPGFTTGVITASPFAATASGTVAAGTNYTLSEQVVIVHTAAGGTSFDAALSVPDSGTTMLLLGTGLTLLGLVARLRTRLS